MSVALELKELSAERTAMLKNAYAVLLRRAELNADDKQQLASIAGELGIPFDDIDIHIETIKRVATLEGELQPDPTDEERQAYNGEVVAIQEVAKGLALDTFGAVLSKMPPEFVVNVFEWVCRGKGPWTAQGSEAVALENVIDGMTQIRGAVMQPFNDARTKIAAMTNPASIEDANRRRQREIAQLKAKYPLAFPAE